MITKALAKFVGALVMIFACVAQADVFNMGGTRDPTTGTWTGAASLEFVMVGNPGNAADTATGSLYGSVPYVYQMGKYDVTVGQYCQFLNAVAKTDTYGLYNNYMATDFPTIKITQSGSSGSYSYSVIGGYIQGANCPIFDVTWGDAARFCNWLQNGQLTGSQGLTTTEDGSYYLNGATSDTALMAVTRKANATYVIPSENEWYKAAYYDPNKLGGAGYWTYPTMSNTAPGNTLPDMGNSVNFDVTDPTNYLTPVGAFSNSPGAYDTYDMGGDVWQWNEAVVTDLSRGVRGISWNHGPSIDLAASIRSSSGPMAETGDIGFRVAMIPEPNILISLLGFGISGLVVYVLRRHEAANE